MEESYIRGKMLINGNLLILLLYMNHEDVLCTCMFGLVCTCNISSKDFNKTDSSFVVFFGFESSSEAHRVHANPIMYESSCPHCQEWAKKKITGDFFLKCLCTCTLYAHTYTYTCTCTSCMYPVYKSIRNTHRCW